MENPKKDTFPPQHQDQQPGKESQINPHRAAAIAYAKEGADVVIVVSYSI